MTAPAVPNSMGMTTLDALMAMSRRPRASPWRCSGVIWCSRLMTMGCTEPSAKPSSTEHKPIARADGKSGYTPNNTAVTTMAPATTACSRTCLATSGSSSRTTAAATANAPRMEPMTDADSPRSCPMSGTTKVCTSQQDESTQFTMMRRRNAGSLSRSHERWGGPPAAAITGGNSSVWRTQNQVAKGSTASKANAARYPSVLPAVLPAWSIISPAKNGPMKLDTAGPMASQLNTWRNWVVSCAARPTWRCSAMMARPVAPPVIRAERHITENTGKISESPAPAHAMTTAMPTGRLRPCRSA